MMTSNPNRSETYSTLTINVDNEWGPIPEWGSIQLPQYMKGR